MNITVIHIYRFGSVRSIFSLVYILLASKKKSFPETFAHTRLFQQNRLLSLMRLFVVSVSFDTIFWESAEFECISTVNKFQWRKTDEQKPKINLSANHLGWKKKQVLQSEKLSKYFVCCFFFSSLTTSYTIHWMERKTNYQSLICTRKIGKFSKAKDDFP